MMQEKPTNALIYEIWIPERCWVRVDLKDLKEGHYNLRIRKEEDTPKVKDGRRIK
jgi:hypothetical protein